MLLLIIVHLLIRVFFLKNLVDEPTSTMLELVTLVEFLLKNIKNYIKGPIIIVHPVNIS